MQKPDTKVFTVSPVSGARANVVIYDRYGQGPFEVERADIPELVGLLVAYEKSHEKA